MPKLNVQQNNANVIKALRNALAIGQIKGPIASDGNDNFTSTGSNRNLLDNWYFVGGGSQLGDGIFPINQRGQTSYVGGATTAIDRWWQQYDATVTLISAGLRLTGKWNISQRLPSVLPNGTYTFSVDVVTLNSAGVTIFFIDQSDQIVAGATKVIDSTGITSLTITSDQIKGVAINLTNPSGTGDITIASAKLEEGTVSTLANDPPPDFGEELRKCKRRFQRINAGSPYYIFATAALAEAASYVVATLDLPVEMATKPILTYGGSFRLWTGTGESPHGINGITIYDSTTPATNCSRVGLIIYSSDNVTADWRYDLQADNNVNSFIDLSCEH